MAAGAGTAVGTLSEMTDADVWFLTVPDTRIATVAGDLVKAIENNRNQHRTSIAVHCSGYHPASVMSSLRELGWHLASVHPMMSFADPGTAAANFPGTLCGVEGDSDALEPIVTLFPKIGGTTFPITSEGKVLYHAAAVISNNFTTVLQGIAREAWAAAGVPDDVARSLNASLLKSTVANIERLGPAEALTGPAARGDHAVVAAEVQATAEWHPEAGQVYEILSILAERLKVSGATLPDHSRRPPLG